MYDHTSFNIVGKIAHFFAENKPLSLLILIGIFFFGIFSFFLTPKQYNPEIVRPAFVIRILYTGATTDEAIDRVVYELVEKVSAVPGVDEVMTEVSDGATIQSTVIFEVGYDTTKAKVDLTTQLEDHGYLARGYITQPQIMEINPETIPVLQLVFSSQGFSVSEIREKVQEISRKLSSIPEVSDASVTGGFVPSLVVEVDPNKLSIQGVTIQDIKNVLSQNGVRAVWRGLENEEFATNIVFDGRIHSPSEVGSLEVRPNVRVRDVASVYFGAPPSQSYVLYASKDIKPTEVVMLSVSKVEGSSAPKVTKEVLGTIDTLLADSFRGMSYTVVSNDGETASKEINGLTGNLMQSMAIVALVLMLFLSFRAASIVLIAIPSTLLIVFGFGLLFDQTINRITLFALILSLGLLVDAAIVTVENIYVHAKRSGKGLFDATREIVIAGSVNEIGIGLFLSTVTSVLVFIPVAYITGMMGPYMGPIAFFMPITLIVSMFVAITIIPFLASKFVSEDEKQSKVTAFIDRYVQKSSAWYGLLMQRIVARRALQKKILIGAFLLFAISLLFPLTGLEHFQMLPRADRNQFYMYIDAPSNTSVTEMHAITEEVSSFITQDKDVISTQLFIATAPIVDFNGMFKGAQSRNEKYQSTLRVNLVDAGERDRSSTEIVSDFREVLTKEKKEYAQMTRFIEEPPGPPVRATLVAKILQSPEGNTEHLIDTLALLFADTEGVVDLEVSTEDPVSDYVYTFDRERARSLAITESEARDALALYGDGMVVGEYMKSGAEYTPILLSLGYENKNEPSDIQSLTLRNTRGELVPLSSVVKETHEEHPRKVYLEREGELTYITGEVEGRPIIYVVLDIILQIARGRVEGYHLAELGFFGMTLEDTEGNTFELVWGGEWKMTIENFRDLGIAMIAALVLVYATLVAQYRSFKKSALIMVTIPLGLIGILTGFLVLDTVFGIYLTATALIGFIALIGIVVNNAIILSEYIDQEVFSGTSYHEAIVQAGMARFRPIILTSLTTILGSLTIASDPVWSGLSWAIIFGLSLSTVLTLIVYPTLLVFLQNNK